MIFIKVLMQVIMDIRIKREFFVHVSLPSEKEIERIIVERKKMKLLSKFASEGLLEE